MKKRIALDSLADLNSVKVGGCLQFLKNGKWYKTSEIVNYCFHCGDIFIETQNSIYTTEDIKTKNRNLNIAFVIFLALVLEKIFCMYILFNIFKKSKGEV